MHGRLTSRRTASLLVAGVLVAPLLAGCASARTDAAREAAESFIAAWSGGDGARVCALLAPDAADEVEQSAGAPCPNAVLDEDLPDSDAVTAVSVWGDEAQVHSTADTLFLARFDTGWKVTAAGCTPQGDQPYDCTVTGG